MFLLMSTEYIVSPADFVSVIREDLKPEAAAPLLCGMYDAVNWSNCTTNRSSWIDHVRGVE